MLYETTNAAVRTFPLFLFSQTTGKVIKISDGDTIILLLKGNQQKKIRLAEVGLSESGQAFGKMRNSLLLLRYSGKR